MLLSEKCSVATAKSPSVTGGNDASGSQWGGFFVLNTLLKLLLLASWRLLLASSLKYSLDFPTNFPFNLKLSQFENGMKFGIKLNYRYLKETQMSCLETAKNFVQEHFLVEKHFNQN